MRILLATDAFPPTCGGSGWSTYELAKALRARGHDLLIAQPRLSPVPGWRTSRDPTSARAGTWPSREDARSGARVEATADAGAYDGFRPLVFPAWAPPVPFLRNYFGNERLYGRFGAWLARLVREARVDVVHAQHLRSGPAAVRAAQQTGVPVVCTVRDYWPVCYWSDLIHARSTDSLCPSCSAAMMTRCLRPHAGWLWPLGLPAIPYMRANLTRKRRALAAADVIVAVSTALARDLRIRAGELAGRRIEVLPNPVDVAGIRADADAQPRRLDSPYAVYIGKLAPNKGVMKLEEALARARLDWPLVVVGDGPERTRLQRALSAAGVTTQVMGWQPRPVALGWLRHAELLVFPSHGPESLSRVLLEASALGIPIAAMNTGGTADIVVHGETGLLFENAVALGDGVGRLRRDPALRRRLGEAAAQRVARHFDSAAVAARVEALYEELCQSRRTRGPLLSAVRPER